eukprot:5597830-Alexandrium_andersonii.AAC.1
MYGATDQLRPRLTKGRVVLLCLLHSGSTKPQDILGSSPSIVLEQGRSLVFAEPSQLELSDSLK